jgi:hypothetical protein
MLSSIILTNFGVAQTPTYKISGYVKNSSGQGIAGANVIFNVPSIVPSVYSGSSGYYEIFAPAGTYHVNVWPPFDSNYLSYDQPVLNVNSGITKNITLSTGYKVSGYLTDSSGTPIRGALVSLNQFHCGWYSNYTGYYFVTASAGTYTLKIQPKTGPSFPTYNEANFIVTKDISKNFILANSPNPSTPPPNENQKIFEVESNSTVSELTFNSTSLSISFTVSGVSGTTGYTKALISKSLVPTFTGASVALDGKNLAFSVSSSISYWILEFTYSHSIHQVVINVENTGQNPPVESQAPVSTIPEYSPFALVLGIALASVALAFARKNSTHHTRVPNSKPSNHKAWLPFSF